MAKEKNNQNTENQLFAKIIAHAKEYGFVFPSSEIYDGLQGVYDYGQNGVELKNNLKQLWWKAMTQCHENIVGIDAAIFMHPTTWKASGHVDSFSDPMIDNKDSKKRYRADNLIEERIEQYKQNQQLDKAYALEAKLNQCLNNNDLDGLKQIIIEENIVCAISGTANWTDVRQFNLMFSTEAGAVAEEASTIYLRPETAQGIFVNFLNVQKTSRQRIPFGIAQIGKAFRNEIVARQFIFRMREFEQMEMQFFVRPTTELEWYEKWKTLRLKFHQAIGLKPEKLRYKVHEKLAHYANAAVDIEYEFPFGFKEIEGIHSRTNFDLSRHQEFAKKKMEYYDEETKERYIPYVVETSVGADRLFLAILCNAYTEDTGIDAEGKEKNRVYLDLHPLLAPIQVAVFPLLRKEGLPEKARQVFELLRYDFRTIYEERGTIGKNYTRQDLIGTPFCLCIDHQTLQDDTLTIRYRNTTEQIRVPIAELKATLYKEINLAQFLQQLNQ
ncbi:MAG: glycine--tRNA ligase [Microscillaceae bacterium]|nr:glycine--tRNA ligase [Microscillaceae bacterium]MDW8460588.1 glycine--tRNA ligase [Cytophagales bacterium]